MSKRDSGLGSSAHSAATWRPLLRPDRTNRGRWQGRATFGKAGPITPKAVTVRGLRAEGVPEPLGTAVTVPAHLAFGAANGAAFALVADHLPGRRLVKGELFALAVMLVSYAGWIPAL